MFDWFHRKPAPAAAFAAPPDRSEIATAARDWTRGWLAPDARVWPQDDIWREQRYHHHTGYDLYRDLLSDWAVFAALQQRRQAVVAAETEVLPGGDRRADRHAAAFIEAALGQIGWDAITDAMHYGVFYGFAVAECLWGRDGAQVTLEAVKPRDRQRFGYDGASRLRLLTGADRGTGELLPERKFWTCATGADHGDEPYGMGLAHWLYWPVIFKRGGVKFWLIAAEKFGSPTAAGWFPPGTSTEDQTKLLTALAAIQTDASLILPEGVRVELLEASRTAGGDYAALCGYMDQAIARIILSQLAPADSTASTLNVSAQEPPAWQRLIKSDADLICESFNRSVVRWLCDWNFPTAVPPRVWRRTEPGADLAQRSEIERRIFDLGYRPTLAHIQGEYDGEWEAVPAVAPLAPAPPAEAEDGDEASEAAAAPAAFAAADPLLPVDPTAPLVERLGAEAAPLLDALLEPVRALLTQSADLDAFRVGLLNLYPALDPSAFAALMEQALAVADAAGRWEARP